MRIQTIEEALQIYAKNNPEIKSIRLTDCIINNITDEFEFHTTNIQDDELFNKVILECIKNAYKIQSYTCS